MSDSRRYELEIEAMRRELSARTPMQSSSPLLRGATTPLRLRASAWI